PLHLAVPFPPSGIRRLFRARGVPVDITRKRLHHRRDVAPRERGVRVLQDLDVFLLCHRRVPPGSLSRSYSFYGRRRRVGLQELPDTPRRPARRSAELGDVRKIAVALFPVEAVPDDEDVRDLPADVVELHLGGALAPLRQERADLERSWISRVEVAQQVRKREAA